MEAIFSFRCSYWLAGPGHMPALAPELWTDAQSSSSVCVLSLSAKRSNLVFQRQCIWQKLHYSRS